jgi:pyruvate,orthophosphate dikinase
MKRQQFTGAFAPMDGFPVFIRTLDPPLHEFVPEREDLLVDLAKLPHADLKTRKEMAARYKMTVGELKKRLPVLLRRVEELHEFNPMLGHRGCRLGITYPDITEMQARAIFEAVVQVHKKGKKVIPEVMIPLIGGVEELRDQKAIVVKVAEEVLGKAGLKGKVKYLVGTMIEIPRAALTANRVAEEAEFFSFGTNDLTQTAMGLSRDDYTKFSKFYEEKKIFKADPSPSSTRKASASLCRWPSSAAAPPAPTSKSASAASTAANPRRSSSATASAWTCVTCSPYRVPIARLAAAQAAITKGEASSEANRTA